MVAFGIPEFFNFLLIKMPTENEEIKEGFCGACIAGVAAMAGAGASSYGTSSKGKHKQRKKILFWSGVLTVLVSAAVIIYYLYIKKCEECA